jgi:hypothetical protein
VFSGAVLDVQVVPHVPGETAFLSTRKARFRVDDSFGGLPADVREVDIYTGSGGGDCGIRFEPGDRYLIQSTLGTDGNLHTGICSSTRRIENAGTFLHLLRQLRNGKPSPTLIGRIAIRHRNDGESPPPRVLASTRIRARSGDKTWETLSDADGIYAFYDLPPGRYNVEPELPPGLRVSRYIGDDEPPAPASVTGRGCWPHDVDVFSSGSIQGRVLDSSNRLLRHATVYLVPEGTSDFSRIASMDSESQTEERGHFRFVHVDPGRYWILMNPSDTRDPAFPYPRTFYPGLRDVGAAGAITVGLGEEVKDADIRLRPSFEPRRLVLRVTWADGRLIRDFVAVKTTGIRNPEAKLDVRYPDTSVSIVNLALVPDEAYRIRAELTCHYRDPDGSGAVERLRTPPVDVSPNDRRTEITLALQVNACPEKE